MIISDRVHIRMTELGLTQTELARRAGVAPQTIYKLLRKANKGSTKLHLIARELETTPAYLTGETDDPNADVVSPSKLSHDEVAWILYWRALDGEGRDEMVRVVRSLISDRLQSLQAVPAA